MAVKVFWSLFKKELREQFHTYRLLIACVAFLVVGISAPLVTKLLPDLLGNAAGNIKIVIPLQTASDALNAYLKNMLQLATPAFILLAMGCIADERSYGTAVTILTKPVPRSIFVLAKFAAYELTLVLSTALAAVSCYYYTVQLFGSLPFGVFLVENAALVVLLSMVLALTVLASTLFRHAVAAGGLAFVGYIALLIVPNLNAALNQALPSALFDSSHVARLLSGTALLGDVLRPMFIGLAFVVGLVVLFCLVFQRQEI
jgi:ABC-2 type transport system permease protein